MYKYCYLELNVLKLLFRVKSYKTIHEHPFHTHIAPYSLTSNNKQTIEYDHFRSPACYLNINE